MQANIPPICVLCQEPQPLLKHPINFTCGHSFCQKCFPYIFFNIMKTSGIKQSFFQEGKRKYPCFICQAGTATISLNKFFKFCQNLPEIEKKQGICESCEAQKSSICCIDCNNLKYCEQCFHHFHELNKKFQAHQTFSLNKQIKMEQKNQFICICPSKRNLEFFCLQCQTSICKYCSKTDHDTHKQALLSEITEKSQSINYKGMKEIISKLIEDFSSVEENVIQSLEQTMKKQTEEYNELLDELINSLKELKEKNKNKSANEYIAVKNRFSIIGSCFSFLHEEIDINRPIHPNKVFHLDRLCPIFLQAAISFRDFKFQAHDENPKFKELKQIISFLQEEQDKNHILSTNDEEFINMNKVNLGEQNEQLFKNPFELLTDLPDILEKESFSPFCYKSDCSTSFILNKETFLVWPDVGNLNFYNLSLRKKEGNLLGNYPSLASITVLSSFPKDFHEQSKQFVYSGDDCGVFKVYSLKSFQEIHKIECGKGILSAVMYEDKYNEFKVSSIDEKFYVLMSYFDESSPLRVYQLTKGGGQIVREINNDKKKLCHSINFYQDEVALKSLFFIGFRKSFVHLYDPKSNTLLATQFESKKTVTSINFLSRTSDVSKEKKIERFLIYTQGNNLIVIADINSGNIIRELAIPNVDYICELCVWDNVQQYLIIGTRRENSIKIINFENLLVLKSIKTDQSWPTNIMKVFKNDQKVNKFKDCFVCLLSSIEKNQRKVQFYE